MKATINDLREVLKTECGKDLEALRDDPVKSEACRRKWTALGAVMLTNAVMHHEFSDEGFTDEPPHYAPTWTGPRP